MPFFSVNSGTLGILVSPTQAGVRQISLASATVPGAFTAPMWSLTGGNAQATIGVGSLPSNGGSPLTALEYRIAAGSAVGMSGTGTGDRIVTSLTNGTPYDFQIRAVNAIGAGPWSDTKSVTPAASSAATYIADTYTATSAGTTAITRPAGAGAGHTIVAIVFASSADPGPATYSAPTGWTAGTGVVESSHGARVFTAPGDVSDLTFTSANPGGIICFAVDGTLQAGSAFVARDFDTDAGDHTTPSITTATDDCVVSVYIQANDGVGGAIGGSPQAGYTRQELVNAAAPRVSVLSREGVSAGTSGTISHDANANFSNRFLLTMAFTG